MQISPTKLKDVLIIQPKVIEDSRGYFFESYRKDALAEAGITEDFVQDNQSYSQKNTLRGLHFQKSPHAQSKLVRVVAGEVFDVAVDIRPDSLTFKQWFGMTLSEQNKTMIYIPAGFAHGFCVTSESAVFVYKCGTVYNKDFDAGILWNDPEIAIDWPVTPAQAIISEKDQQLPFLKEI